VEAQNGKEGENKVSHSSVGKKARINKSLPSATKKNSINSTVQGLLRKLLEIILCQGYKPVRLVTVFTERPLL
jgi:hypothetical protein